VRWRATAPQPDAFNNNRINDDFRSEAAGARAALLKAPKLDSLPGRAVLFNGQSIK
jgi:hypothetical protein